MLSTNVQPIDRLDGVFFLSADLRVLCAVHAHFLARQPFHKPPRLRLPHFYIAVRYWLGLMCSNIRCAAFLRALVIQ